MFVVEGRTPLLPAVCTWAAFTGMKTAEFFLQRVALVFKVDSGAPGLALADSADRGAALGRTHRLVGAHRAPQHRVCHPGPDPPALLGPGSGAGVAG